jgi:hypothetical protein
MERRIDSSSGAGIRRIADKRNSYPSSFLMFAKKSLLGFLPRTRFYGDIPSRHHEQTYISAQMMSRDGKTERCGGWHGAEHHQPRAVRVDDRDGHYGFVVSNTNGVFTPEPADLLSVIDWLTTPMCHS